MTTAQRKTHRPEPSLIRVLADKVIRAYSSCLQLLVVVPDEYAPALQIEIQRAMGRAGRVRPVISLSNESKPKKAFEMFRGRGEGIMISRRKVNFPGRVDTLFLVDDCNRSKQTLNVEKPRGSRFVEETANLRKISAAIVIDLSDKELLRLLLERKVIAPEGQKLHLSFDAFSFRGEILAMWASNHPRPQQGSKVSNLMLPHVYEGLSRHFDSTIAEAILAFWGRKGN